MIHSAWLSPSGKIIKCGFAEHIRCAYEIITGKDAERLDNNSIGNIEEEQLLYLLKHYFHCLYVSFKDKVCIYNKKEYLNYDEIIQVLKDNKEKFYNEGKFITLE